MSHENEDFLNLSSEESKRLAAWLSQLDPLPEINSGRWWYLCHGSTWVSHRELKALADFAPMGWMLADILKGTVTLNQDVFRLKESPMP